MTMRSAVGGLMSMVVGASFFATALSSGEPFRGVVGGVSIVAGACMLISARRRSLAEREAGVPTYQPMLDDTLIATPMQVPFTAPIVPVLSLFVGFFGLFAALMPPVSAGSLCVAPVMGLAAYALMQHVRGRLMRRAFARADLMRVPGEYEPGTLVPLELTLVTRRELALEPARSSVSLINRSGCVTEPFEPAPLIAGLHRELVWVRLPVDADGRQTVRLRLGVRGGPDLRFELKLPPIQAS